MKNNSFTTLRKGFLFFFSPVLLFACSPSYKAYRSNYVEEAKSVKDKTPDYSNLYCWAAHPLKKDPSDSVPKTIIQTKRYPEADVFFIHPTTLTSKKNEGIIWNAAINDPELNLKTDYTSMLYQASVFNGSSRVFAPRYRQAHIYAFRTKDTARAIEAFQLAYADIRRAFLHYLNNENNGRPIIIASHSQGTLHARWLMKEFFDGKPLQKQLVCAYLIGLTLPKGELTQIPVCENDSSTGCYMGWRTYRKGHVPEFIQQEKQKTVVVNPLSWTTDSERKSRNMNEAAVLFRFNKPYKHTNGAQVNDQVLWIEKPRFPFSFLDSRKNYHAGDINLFYLNIRRNVEKRVNAFLQKENLR